MAHVLIMPRQGNTVESCIITDWKVKEGDTVTAETTICEVETDKASFEVAAGAAGTVLKLLYDSGADVPVLEPIAVIGEVSEDWQTLISGESSRKGAKTLREEIINKEDTALNSSPGVLASWRDDNPAVSPRARHLAEKEALPLQALPGGSGPDGRIIERDVAAALQNRPPLTAAAKAAGAAALPAVGSGLGGRITLDDLAAGPQLPASIPLYSEGAVTETPIKGIRKIIADRMYRSLAESAQLSLSASAPAAKLLDFRSAVKAQSSLAEDLGLAKITINDLILFAVSRTLPRYPFMNAHKIGDVIKTFERVHLAVAVDTPRGLMVPVIRNANLLSLTQISSEAKRLAAACQNGTANPDELSGSTFTVTNLGSFGISSFTPVLNSPEVAILGVCSIEMKPAALPGVQCNCGSGFEPQIGFSLTINHQAVDGAPAARFLQALGETVAHIDLLLAAD